MFHVCTPSYLFSLRHSVSIEKITSPGRPFIQTGKEFVAFIYSHPPVSCFPAFRLKLIHFFLRLFRFSYIPRVLYGSPAFSSFYLPSPLGPLGIDDGALGQLLGSAPQFERGQVFKSHCRPSLTGVFGRDSPQFLELFFFSVGVSLVLTLPLKKFWTLFSRFLASLLVLSLRG